MRTLNDYSFAGYRFASSEIAIFEDAQTRDSWVHGLDDFSVTFGADAENRVSLTAQDVADAILIGGEADMVFLVEECSKPDLFNDGIRWLTL